MKLIVGLGNPSPDYASTRHNIGFDVLDAFAAKCGWIGTEPEFNRLAKTKFDGLALDGAVDSEKVLLLKPMTYMNVSGKSVQAARAFYRLAPDEILIVLDDVALPTGRLRLRRWGTPGGHNGLKDIERMLGTQEYPRLRIGIGPRPPQVPQRDYVLGKFSPEQREKLKPVIDRACGAIATWIESGIVAAMNQYNAAEEERE